MQRWGNKDRRQLREVSKSLRWHYKCEKDCEEGAERGHGRRFEQRCEQGMKCGMFSYLYLEFIMEIDVA